MKSGKNQNVDYILVNLMPPPTTAPCFQKAKQHRQLYSAAGRNKGQSQIKLALLFHTRIFKRYGSGVYLYFTLFKMLFLTFLIISFNSLPIILSNFKGDGLKMYGEQSITKSLMQISLGNQRHEDYQLVLKQPNVKTDIFVSQTIIVIIDVINSLIFFIFLIFWKIKSEKAVSQLISEDALPSYYTLQVKNLPSSYTQDLMKEHFRKFGADIAQISTVYNYQNVLSQVKKLTSLINEYESLSELKKSKIYEQIQQQLQKVRQLTKCKTLKPVQSIVTFQDMIMRQKIRDLYRYKVCPRELRLQGKMLKVQSCKVEPSSILWENYHLQVKSEIRQSIFITIILVSVLFVALIAQFLINAHSTSLVERQQAFSKQFDYNKDYTYERAKELGTLESLFVFCSQLNYRNFTLDYYYFCKPYFNAYGQKFMTMIGLSLIVMVINMILNLIIAVLAHYRRYKTKTQKNRFLIFNSFVLNFINSALLILLIRVQIGGFSLSNLISKIISLPQSQFSLQPYADFDRKWYINIGSQIVVIYAISLIFSPFVQIILYWMLAKFRAFKAKRARTQYQMNEALIDSQFDFQAFYVMMLNTCFFTMFYGNAIPLLYVLSIGAFVSLYVASFIVFQFFSCKPVLFDHTLNSVISRIMCMALVLHQITSILFLYTDDIFPLQDEPKTENQGQRLARKIQQGSHFIILFVFVIVFTFNYNRACKIAKKYFNKCFHPTLATVKQPKLFNQVFEIEQLQVQSVSTQQLVHRTRKSDCLFSYKMQDNPSYSNISYALKILSIFQPYFSSNNNQESHSRSSTCKNILTESLRKSKQIKYILSTDSFGQNQPIKHQQQMIHEEEKNSLREQEKETERPFTLYMQISKNKDDI